VTDTLNSEIHGTDPIYCHYLSSPLVSHQSVINEHRGKTGHTKAR